MDKQVSSTQNPYAEPTSLRGGGVKILVCYHKKDKLFKNDVLVPIHCGRALACETSKDGKMSEKDYQWMLDNMIGDDTGDNISELNRNFNELTAIYWAWKNYDKLGNPDYIGLAHYRRFLDINDCRNKEKTLKQIFNIKDNLQKLCSEYDLIIPAYKTQSDKDIQNDMFSQTKCIIDILEKYHPELKVQYEKYLNERKMYFANMFIMKKELFFEYCELLFDIIFKLEKEPEMSWNRAIGYSGEYISTLIFYYFIERGYKHLCQKVIIYYPAWTAYAFDFINSKFNLSKKIRNEKEIVFHRNKIMQRTNKHMVIILYDSTISKFLYFIIGIIDDIFPQIKRFCNGIFSVRNECYKNKKHKVFTIAGLKIKIKQLTRKGSYEI